MNKVTLSFIMNAPKKHSVRYQNEQYSMTLYIMNDVLEKMGASSSVPPKAINVTFEVPDAGQQD